MNDFENFLRRNKQQLELDEVNPDIWAAIEKGVEGKKRGARISFVRKIAAIAAVFLIGFAIYQFNFSNSKINIPQALLANYGFENANVTELLEAKINAIKTSTIPVSYKADLQSLLSQANYLDRRYESQLTYLKEKPYEEEIAIEILKYYKAKSNLLDKVILEIQKINNNEKEYNIKSERTYIKL